MGGRRWLVVAVVATALVLVGSVAPAGAAASRENTETAFVARINELRANKGLGPLAVDPALREVAREWAGRMASAGRISHRPDLATAAPSPDWLKIGENVGVGASVASLHEAFVASHAHYVNLVDPVWQYIGIGVVFDGDTIYVAENFMQVEVSVPSASAGGPERAAPPVAEPQPAPVLIAHLRAHAQPSAVLACTDRGCPAARRWVARR